ncbi:MAG TPA: ABC transporter ATP-binding protein [Candidatus Limnocylindrales bacterium]|nr:ABC transporter ATP-binding protein [Candidatus Limnocylindrales bacterium]
MTVTAERPPTAPSSTKLIELEAISRSFRTPLGDVNAVDRVSLAFDAAEVLCIVGESGCGKTTTGRLLAGLLRPTGGRLLFEGQDVWQTKGAALKRFRKAVQLVHQDPYASLNPTRTVAQTLLAPLQHHRRVKGARAARAAATELLERVGLVPAADFLAKYPHQLSGGQRQRVSIARALTVEPRVIVADEAVSMVDVSIRISLLNLLLSLRREFGVTIVLITHDLAVARFFAREGRIAVMYLGRVVELGPTEKLVVDPAHPYAEALIAAIPEADPTITRTKERVPLRSAEVPSLLDLPPGCTFHPRCPRFEPGLCDVVRPDLTAIPGDREVACHPAVRERTGKPTADGT